MSFVSILNDVLGPVMRGPSSSHNAGAYRIASLARALLGERPTAARFAFDPEGSYAPTYVVCGVDLAFTSALLGIPLTDPGFFGAHARARSEGLAVEFETRPLERADHPNYVSMELEGCSGRRLEAAAASIGGGVIAYREVDGLPAPLDGKAWETLVRHRTEAAGRVEAALGPPASRETVGEVSLALWRSVEAPAERRLDALGETVGVERVYVSPPVFALQRGAPPFGSAVELLDYAEARGLGLGEAALAYESQVLGMAEEECLAEAARRLAVMRGSVEQGFAERELHLRYLQPSAAEMLRREAAGRLALGGPTARAAARALAATHVNNSMGVVCAAPTGGSAGTLPGVLVTLADDLGIAEETALRALLAAGAVGLILAIRGTFAAETAGCQVEIGAAGAMAAAAVVDAFGGSAREACDAAAIAFHSAMGLVCDPVGGGCEIPCHTRNALAASGAFTCADLILGGYANPIPLDETIDAVMAVGALMAPELRCTARGGIAIAPSALALVGRQSGE